MALPFGVVDGLRVLHYGTPVALFLWFVGSSLATACTLQNLNVSAKRWRRLFILAIQFVLMATYVSEALVIIFHIFGAVEWWPEQHDMINLLASTAVWGFLQLCLLETLKPVWYPYFGAWAIAFVSESVLLELSFQAGTPSSGYEAARLICRALRVTVFLFAACGVHFLRRYDVDPVEDETTGLLSAATTPSEGYGSTEPVEDYEAIREQRRVRLMEKMGASGNWWTYAKSYSIFAKLMWPRNEKSLKFSLMVVGGCMGVERVLKVLVPRQLGIVTNMLSEGSGVPWLQLSLFILYRWLDGGSGVSTVRTYFWLPINQYSNKAITTAAYDHIMNLSYEFHSNKKTSELWTAMDGGRSINSLVDMLCFQLIPMFVDLWIAFGYFYYLFNAYMSLIVAVVSVTYMWTTIKLSNRKLEVRREIVKAARAQGHQMSETVGNWTTVSYFNRIAYEQGRFAKTVERYLQTLRDWELGNTVIHLLQSLVFTLGLLAGCFVAVYQVGSGKNKVGSFVTLLTYWAQLQGPLGFFASCFRQIQGHLIDAEMLLEVFQTEPTIKDSATAIQLTSVKGEISFDNVGFSYDSRKVTLEKVSFNIPAGKTVALVGETGGGKTTCLRLLFRYYDVKAGSIRIDGVDIRDIQLKSLRDHLGVVPQDPVLFNVTLMENLKYARLDASNEDVFNACRAASIHEKILEFPDGYQSTVGERGIRLSGGELQRVAIARAILRNPEIILLDEATSMIDMETESQIQSALTALSKNRTMFVVAHRLSTIRNADLIVVIKGGAVLEQGTHDQLLKSAEGHYRQLWLRQSGGKGPQGSNAEPVSLLDDTRVEGSGGSKLSEFKPLLAQNKNMDSISNQGTAETSQDSATNHTVPIGIPSGTSKGVTSSLPDRPSKLPQPYRSNPRLFPPPNSMLKGFLDRSTQNSARALGSKASTSRLKPDAKEFVPQYLNSVTSKPAVEQTDASQTASNVQFAVADTAAKKKVMSEASKGVEALNGVKPSNGVESSNGVKPSNGVEPSNGVKPSNGVESSNGVEPSNGVESSNGIAVDEGKSVLQTSEPAQKPVLVETSPSSVTATPVKATETNSQKKKRRRMRKGLSEQTNELESSKGDLNHSSGEEGLNVAVLVQKDLSSVGNANGGKNQDPAKVQPSKPTNGVIKASRSTPNAISGGENAKPWHGRRGSYRKNGNKGRKANAPP